KIVSSSLIRNLIERGAIVEANSLLERHYSLEARVVKGRGEGRKLGFPTVNLIPPDRLLPKFGVYAGYLNMKKERYLCAVNIGFGPTLKGKKKPLIEVHIINSDKAPEAGLRLFFLERIRAEKKFRSPQILQSVIRKDVKYIASKYSTLP
ncbi:MAG: bifunctional riboflavin kinase/FMN adenylyltransferase, partial [Candidatus Omnitrophica bacterium]|nr:bifunctional riboflavin kinase/FMN adenylyltransferase [Candidatus Omnitrophota bacterium]